MFSVILFSVVALLVVLFTGKEAKLLVVIKNNATKIILSLIFIVYLFYKINNVNI